MRRAKNLSIFVLSISFLLVLPLLSYADGIYDKNLHYFQPPPDGSGIILTYGSEPLNWLGIHYGLVADEAQVHVTYVPPHGEKEIFVQNQVGANALLGVGITRFFNVGVALPFVVWREFNDKYIDKYHITNAKESAIEDMRIDVKGILLNRRANCLGVAAAVTTTVPLDALENNFLSDMQPTVTPRLIVDFGRRRWNVAFNAGYKHYSKESTSPIIKMEIKDEVLLSFGGKLRISQMNELMGDALFRTQAASFFTDPNYNYGEFIGAYRRLFGSYSLFALTIGAGGGVMDGVGTPSVRVFIGLTSYEYRLGF